MIFIFIKKRDRICFEMIKFWNNILLSLGMFKTAF